MNQIKSRFADIGLHWSLGLILGYESARLAFTSSHYALYAHLPRVLLLLIAVAELAGAILFLVPSTIKLGGYTLLATLLVAALAHILHGQPDVGNLVIYWFAVLVVLAHRRA